MAEGSALSTPQRRDRPCRGRLITSTSKTGEEEEGGNPNWTRSFCEALDKLVVASPCGDDMGLLGLFIRYTVACRMSPRRVRGKNPFLGILYYPHPFDMTEAQIHVVNLQLLAADGDMIRDATESALGRLRSARTLLADLYCRSHYPRAARLLSRVDRPLDPRHWSFAVA
ncbi:hypothetical protein F4819DRAFT_316837 [Hypoxylon fuscum]|nr:hypothetical protein F4819DRAFT_316837 [Hypoxylon fuscum]